MFTPTIAQGLGQKSELENILENISYVCGSTFSEIERDEESVLNEVYVKANVMCNCPIEIPYFSAWYEPICYFCGSENGLEDQCDCYPFCIACSDLSTLTIWLCDTRF